MTARFWTSQYEWYAHRREAEKAGVDAAVIAAIAARRTPVLTDPKARAVYEYAMALHGTHQVPQAVHDAAVGALGETGTVELVGVLGYYTLVAMTLNAFEIEVARGGGRGAFALSGAGSGRLAGKVAIVTGAGCVGPGWGNGRAAAVAFAREGARVFAVDLHADAMAETVERARDAAGPGGEIRTHVCDAGESEAVGGMVAACLAAFGRVDILVNNVGGSAKGGAVTLSEADWGRQLAFNLTTVFLGCKHVIPAMLEGGGGSIVNTASTSGQR